MNEQERAAYFSTQLDALLQKSAPVVADENLDETDQALLDMARLMNALDFSSQSRFLQRVQQPQGVEPMTTIWTGRRLLAGFGAIFLFLLLAIATITPMRVLAQELWQSLFVRHDSSSLTLSEPAIISAEPTATPIAAAAPNISIREATAAAPFTVCEPAFVPAGYTLSSVYYDESRQRVTFLYLHGGLGISLHQEPTEAAAPWVIGPAAAIETVKIGSLLGEYVRGTWADIEQNDGLTITVTERVWDSADPYQQLRWIEGDILYTLGTTVGQDIGLSQSDLIAIAVSLNICQAK